jgi:hypothetical protein
MGSSPLTYKVFSFFIVRVLIRVGQLYRSVTSGNETFSELNVCVSEIRILSNYGQIFNIVYIKNSSFQALNSTVIYIHPQFLSGAHERIMDKNVFVIHLKINESGKRKKI